MKDSKSIYELLNQVDSNIEDYEKEKLSDIEKQKLKANFRKRNKKKFNFKKVTAIAAALALATAITVNQTNLGGNVYAATQSKILEISYSIGKALGIERNIKPYANIVDQVVENKGVEIKLTDVIIDKDELIFCTIANTNQPMDGFHFDYDIFINGKRLRNYGASGSAGAIDDSNTLFFATYAVDIKEIDTDENVDIKIVLKDISYHYIGDRIEELKEGEEIERKEIKGKWEFEFTANGNELTEHTYSLPINYSFNIDNTNYTLEEFRYNPVNQKIFGEVENRSEDFYVIDFKGQDNLGNEVVFGLSRMDGTNLIFKYQNIHGNLSDEITSITLAPYAAKQPKKSGRESNDYKQVGEEFTILLNK